MMIKSVDLDALVAHATKVTGGETSLPIWGTTKDYAIVYGDNWQCLIIGHWTLIMSDSINQADLFYKIVMKLTMGKMGV